MDTPSIDKEIRRAEKIAAELAKKEENIHAVILRNRDLRNAIKEFASSDAEAEKLYTRYLETIFPGSTIQDILWHATDQDFEKFSREHIGKNTLPELIEHGGHGFYFSRDSGIHHQWYRKQALPAKVNLTEDNDDNHDSGDVVISDPENIHILGTKDDIEKFKEFVTQNKGK